jgi:hypothetical protein
VSLAALITAQKAEHGLPHLVSCRALRVSQASFYKRRRGDGSPRRQRRKAKAAASQFIRVVRYSLGIVSRNVPF